ncbi:MAG: hypothetical protein ACXQTP_05580, partial [Candidatus Methanofastidiosia archaeon]
NVWGNGYAEVKGVWELNDYITDIRYPWNFASPYQHWRDHIDKAPGGGTSPPGGKYIMDIMLGYTSKV